MPHISLIHSPNMAPFIDNLLSKVNDAFIETVPNTTGVKCYAIPLTACQVNGDNQIGLLHLNLRVLRKPERTIELIEHWTNTLLLTLQSEVPEDVNITAEANFLPEVYFSKTA
ncbi:hypothetical protein DES40_1364 [Litorimonas taeanensis]|uniref:5-carboxymethyl-2-hydroxymuconate isomerase n=1 Tax=Litorimonas taeanensis TaxID=568099 RepID=A0A420WLW7_9PROT|nr:hypothetical protein [Litorimonas taeanensis]RKQ72028.1 hypothetical protein DES40_1364 [Litorimonas taeanensis]